MDLRAIGMGLAFALMWSSAFTSARMIVADAPPLMALTARFVISGGLAVALALAAGQSWRLNRGQLRATVIFGLCQNALYLGLYFVALQTIEAGLGAIIASAMPLIVGLAGALAFEDRVGWRGAAGLVAGFLGVALIMGSRVGGGADATGLVLCVIAVLALAVATLSVRSASAGGNLLMVVGLQMLVGAAILAPFGLALEEPVVNWSWTLAGAFAYTTLVPGLAATWIWFRLVDRVGATRASTFHFLNPVFGVAVGALVLGEALRPVDALGVAFIAGGILAVQTARTSLASRPFERL